MKPYRLWSYNLPTISWPRSVCRIAVEYVDLGGSQTSTANIFGITSRTIWNWIQRKNQNKLEQKKNETSPRKIDNEQLKQFIKKHPDAYLREIVEVFDVDPSTVFYACKRLKITLKKTSSYRERRNLKAVMNS